MDPVESCELAYWERNMLALWYADGWYNDDIPVGDDLETPQGAPLLKPRYSGWRRVLTLHAGRITFHIPDDFDVGTLAEVKPNWDGHTTEEKWRRIASGRGVKLDD